MWQTPHLGNIYFPYPHSRLGLASKLIQDGFNVERWTKANFTLVPKKVSFPLSEKVRQSLVTSWVLLNARFSMAKSRRSAKIVNPCVPSLKIMHPSLDRAAEKLPTRVWIGPLKITHPRWFGPLKSRTFTVPGG